MAHCGNGCIGSGNSAVETANWATNKAKTLQEHGLMVGEEK
jgi:hypothetical protein